MVEGTVYFLLAQPLNSEKVLTTAMIELLYTRVSTLSGAYEVPQVVLADWEQSMRAILRSIDELHLNRVYRTRYAFVQIFKNSTVA